MEAIFDYGFSKNVLDVDCQTHGRLKLMIKLYVSEICHKFQIRYRRATTLGAPSYFWW
jgi:hypothetical protein